jgi:hypothetical protein
MERGPSVWFIYLYRQIDVFLGFFPWLLVPWGEALPHRKRFMALPQASEGLESPL